MRHWIFFWVLLLSFAHQAISQIPQLTGKSQISVLTCAKGDDLITSFGHTAIRVQDSTLGIDVVYNYGTFDFNRPNFYLNFVKGRLIYSLSRSRFDRFLFAYEMERRWVKEQILDLDLHEKNKLFAFLENNYLPQNRDYLYDPLLNNCSSMVGDILKQQFGDAIVFDGSYLDKQYSFRELVRQNLATNSWSSFGIDVAFGSVVDRKATVKEHTFLPSYAMQQLTNTTKNGKPLVQRERTILDYDEFDVDNFFPLSPLFWFTLLFLFTATITYLDHKHGSRSRWLDFSLFLVTGFIGLVLALIWFGADHTSTPKNFNLLWAFPFNFAIAFIYIFQSKLPDWFSKYLKVLLGLLALTVLVWIFNIQSFSPLLILILLTLAVRYVFLLKFLRV
ncbi:lipoprotein N-acyltransferase Lnb domain-containing protein [Flagellimonas sp. 2504JD1-5]